MNSMSAMSRSDNAHVFKKRVADAPGDPQVGSVAGQVKRDFEYHNTKSVPEM